MNPEESRLMDDFDREAIVASFLVEADEGLALMEQALVSIEDNASDEALNDIFRVSHTIKGNASSLGFPDLAGFAHVVEDLLDVLRNRQVPVTKTIVSLLLNAVDTLRALVPSSAAGIQGLTVEQEDLKVQIAVAAAGRERSDASQNPDFVAPGSTSLTGGANGVHSAGGMRRTLRADIDSLDLMLNLSGEIAIAQGRLRQIIEQFKDGRALELLEVHRETERLFRDLQEKVMRIRMVPVGPVFRQLVRTVRDVARNHDKLAKLEIIGEEVEVDTTVVEHLKDALMHMVRNAVDHGIEMPSVREAAGKAPCGVIKITATHSAGNIIIQVQDDGAGFNRRRIAEKAKSLGLVTDTDRISDDELFRLVFEAGFSTAESITDLSGRGVGMDVVRRNIDALHGSINVSSKEGSGTTITIRLPLTLAIMDGFSVTCGEDTFIIPLEYVTECVELPLEQQNGHSSDIINLRGDALPFVRLRDVFRNSSKSAVRENVVVVNTGDLRAGIAVDHLLGATQAVIKPLAKVFQGIPEISGSTILGDGRVGLIIDVPGLMRQVTHTN